MHRFLVRGRRCGRLRLCLYSVWRGQIFQCDVLCSVSWREVGVGLGHCSFWIGGWHATPALPTSLLFMGEAAAHVVEVDGAVQRRMVLTVWCEKLHESLIYWLTLPP